MRGLRPSERRRLNVCVWTVTLLAAVAGLVLGLSGGTVERVPYDEFIEPARPYWTSEQLGVVPFALPGAHAPAASLPNSSLLCRPAEWSTESS